MLNITNDMLQMKNYIQSTALVSIDLSVTFDLVDHNILVNCLENNFGNSSQKIIVMVNDQPVSMIIDSGASCNLITPEIADNLIRHGAKRVSNETKIWPYGSPPIVSTYYLDATVNFREVQTRAKLVVVDSNASSLMGKSTAEELSVLKIMVNALSNDELFSAYPNVVNKKLGKLKDCEVKHNNQVPLSISELPDGPWMNISMDFCGPIPS